MTRRMKTYLLETGLKPDEVEYISANICDDPTSNKVDVLIEENNAPYTYVGSSFISGLGLFAAKDILKGDLVIDCKHFLMQDEQSKFSYINHSREPNCDWFTNISKIVANRNIPKGTELFIDYRKEIRPNRVEYPEWI